MARGSAPRTSASPPVLAKGSASDATIMIRIARPTLAFGPAALENIGYHGRLADPSQPPDGAQASSASRAVRRARAESREVVELRALAQRQPELSQAAELHIEIVELHRRI